MTRPPRVPLVTDVEATPAQSAVFDSVRRPDGRVLNIFRALATHADLTRRWLVFGNHVLAKSTLPPRVRELAILRVGWLCHSEYDVYGGPIDDARHRLMARRSPDRRPRHSHASAL